MSFLGLEGRSILVMGLANKRSVASAAGRVLEEAGAKLIFSVRSAERVETAKKLFPRAEVEVCDVAEEGGLSRLAASVRERHPVIHGLVHSIAFARYEDGPKPFYQVSRREFLESLQVSCHSLIEAAGAFRTLFDPDASVVATSISTTTMAADNYGYMAPVKAALDSSIVFLAKSFSASSRVRFNAVAAGPLKTSASAGIPGYVDSYLYAEQATLRKRGLETGEVADTIAFLLSPRSSGINAQRIVVDAGMGVNYFDGDLVRRATKG